MNRLLALKRAFWCALVKRREFGCTRNRVYRSLLPRETLASPSRRRVSRCCCCVLAAAAVVVVVVVVVVVSGGSHATSFPRRR